MVTRLIVVYFPVVMTQLNEGYRYVISHFLIKMITNYFYVCEQSLVGELRKTRKSKPGLIFLYLFIFPYVLLTFMTVLFTYFCHFVCIIACLVKCKM